LISDVAVVDQVLGAHAGSLGGDLVAYKNHVYRVVNLCVRLASATAEELHRIAIAAVFHDLGIWTAGTFDYLSPSVALAKAYLLRSSAVDLLPEVEAMILEHHKISPYRGPSQPLVEAFRKADWIDVSRGFLTFGIPRRFVAELYARWPSAGFHRRLVQLSLGRFRSNPWSPLPMVRW
jgi:HD domain